METTSSFGNMYLKLRNRIAEKAPSIRYTDQDLGQLDFFDTRPPVSFPCVLIDIDDMVFDESGELTQTGEGSIVVRVGFDCWSPSNGLVNEDVARLSLEYYEGEQEVYLALQGWADDNFGKLTRQSVVTEKRNDNYRVRKMRFKVGMEDESAKPKRITVARPEPIIVTS